ncbi:MAG: formimidoylglutamate deiminase [Intrasporangium sp.]|uniref:formimidoylglutamate deiminase n=1 Tax=Intrasporangium sp. TaxID=1925024 RepID=UPI0026480985|nr:formimidoylglutamate deiminase [Intrasporangium sp.]MDN5796592.1 formimidoylglutamate deiminase [Intrasporangium sp.]
MTTFHCEQAWLGGDFATRDVLIETADGVITAVTAGVPAPEGVVVLPGLTLPGLANTHSHVFHRAIRGHSQSGVADFWLWRDLMYSVAERLTPELMYDLARATYAEMALSGVTSVGEFHYVHHQAAGERYADPNEMSRAVIRAANDAGIRITLIDTCYLQADVHGAPLTGVQRRFDDGSWQAWAQRVAQLGSGPMHRTGAAIHSVRAVPRAAMGPIARTAREHGWPLHVHLSEQPAENRAALEAFGLTPTAVLAAEGALGATTTAVHATHLTDADIADLGGSRTFISMCCTTERDLADGVGPAVRLLAAGSPLCVGSDAHMMIDLWEEARAIELDERLVSGTRGHLSVGDLVRAMTTDGATSIGWPEAGSIAQGAVADLVTVRLDSPRTAGARSGDALAHVVFAATAADVTDVFVGGRPVVREGRHRSVDVGRALESAVAAALGAVDSLG